jgi:V8-like Glu-specific endopeptidase
MIKVSIFALCVSVVVASSAETDPVARSHLDAVNKHVKIDTNSEKGRSKRVVFATELEEPQASWVRVQFDAVALTADTEVVITSRYDGAVQHLNAKTMKQWGHTSAYFNGDAVTVEVIATPHTGIQSLNIASVIVGEKTHHKYENTSGYGTICGTNDDRKRSTDPRVSRLMSASGGGCTAWLINDPKGCQLSCAHCSVSGGSIVQYNVPSSLSSGAVQHPPPSDQYAVDAESIQAPSRYDMSSDWAYFGTFPNTETGQTAREQAGGAYYTLATSMPSASRQTLRVTGHGVTSPRENINSQAQQTDTGAFMSIVGHVVRHRVDTTGGNSGGPVEVEGGTAFAIHGYGGCTSSGSTSGNGATALSNPDLQESLANPRGVCA